MAGNSVIIKPPEQAPLSASILAEVCAQVLPPGLVNIVTGTGPVAGDAIVRHPGIKRIAFIGSVPTGMMIQRAAAEVGVKHITLELGGKNPMIVFPDADLDQAVRGAVAGMNFTHQGQSCGSTSRLMLHDSIHDEFLSRDVERVSALRIGDPMDEQTEMGPMVSAEQLAKTLHYIDAGRQDGASLMTGGATPEGAAFERGYIWINGTSSHYLGTPFGGMKNSGIGREEILDELRSYTETKTVHVMLN